MSLRRLVRVVAILTGLAPGAGHSSPPGPEDAEAQQAAISLGHLGRSPSGKLSFEVETPSSPKGDPETRVVVRKRGIKEPTASVPLGRPRNVFVRFVVGDNLWAEWSCGSSCTVGMLFASNGRKLASLENLEVSPDGLLAVSLNILDLKTGDADVAMIDLRTGKTLSTWKRQPGIWTACERRWEPDGLLFLPCDPAKPPARFAVHRPTHP